MACSVPLEGAVDTGGLQVKGKGFAIDLVPGTCALGIEKANMFLPHLLHLLQCLPKCPLLVYVREDERRSDGLQTVRPFGHLSSEGCF